MADIAQLETLTQEQLAQIPGQPPPPGVTPDFANPATSAIPSQIVTGIFLGLACISFLIRFHVKVFETKQWRWDDTTITLGFLMSVVQFVSVIMGENYGTIGRHFWEVHLDAEFSPWNYFCVIATRVLGTPALGLIKGTFFIQYWHIFSAVKWMRIGIYIGSTITFLYYFSTGIAFIALTVPWPGESSNPIAVLNTWHFFAAGVLVPPSGYIGVILDWYILLLPMPIIYKLQMPLKKKIGIVLIIATGVLACVSSILGVIYRVQYGSVYDDQTWLIVPIFFWALMEQFCGVIAANMPSIHQLWVRKIASLRSDSKSSLGEKIRSAIGVHSSHEHTARKSIVAKPSHPSFRGEVPMDSLPRPSGQSDHHSDLTVTELYHNERMGV